MLQTANIQATESFVAIYVITHARNGFYNPDTKKNSKTARKEKLLHQLHLSQTIRWGRFNGD